MKLPPDDWSKAIADKSAATTHSSAGYWARIKDAFPVSPGHTLVISRKGFKGLSECPPEAIVDLHSFIKLIKAELSNTEHPPQGFNIGINEGEAAGQTIDLLHIHIIPRYRGDVDNPRGGVRGVIPSKQKY